MRTKLTLICLFFIIVSVQAQYSDGQNLGPNINVVDDAGWRGNLYVQNRIRMGAQLELGVGNENGTPNRALASYTSHTGDFLYLNTSSSNGISDFAQGTYLNSRVAIGNRPYWETPDFFTNDIILAVNGRTWINGKTFINDKLVLGKNTSDSHKLSFQSYQDGDDYKSEIDYRGSLVFKGLDGYASVSSWQTLALTQNGHVLVNMKEEDIQSQYADYKFQVNGKAIVEALKVVGDVPESDYVFEDDYKLRTLEEVETFVTKNKHLPEIPSAADFKENGYLVGEMDDVLLRKVEELTLYMIEANKQIEALKKEVVLLQSAK
ncbi:hypothetical protein [Aquimarina pacifica]|uniref:hypothetical protein n=1 Tax=Aquimarina pacifica TaxID=1296415 RepID=UPI0004718DDB|nr:hypothetical protein [Aquimarina pacifica]